MLPKTPIKLSLDEARKIALLSQGIHRKHLLGSGKKATLSAIEHLSYIQIDTISVVQRAHHHSLWNRVKDYHPQQIDTLLEERKIFEYWSHAAAYLPMEDYRFSLPRKTAFASGQRHWFQKNRKLSEHILQKIASDGPLQARDFKEKRKKSTGWWDWKPAKIALEQLFMEGRLMVVKRLGFQKLYDLTERVLPASVDTSSPTQREYCQHLIHTYLTAHGIATVNEIGYLRKGMNNSLNTHTAEMLNSGELVELEVAKKRYICRPDILSILQQRLSRSKVVIFSPFDNLLIQRQRLKDLFQFDYSLECYLPETKRQFGYFCLPLLWGRRFAGRMDVKMDRKSGILTIRHLHLETEKIDEFLHALQPSLKEFMIFNEAAQLHILKISRRGDPYSPTDIQQFERKLKN